MSLRTILIFPDFENIEIIEKIRQKYDPQVSLIRPHITLVFPFESKIGNKELEQILRGKIKNVCPFEIELTGFSKHSDEFGNYIFLSISKGKREIEKIHRLLYESELKEFDLGRTYMPHMTVGKLPTPELLDEVYNEIIKSTDVFKTVVDKISVEMIGENGESIIIFEVAL